MSKKKIDILLLARPDHSYTIYKGLLKSGLNFIYCSFKLMPQCLKGFVKNPRVRYYSDHYSSCKLLTLFHIYRVKYKKENLEKYEKNLYEWHLGHLLNKVEPKMIHYWPYLSYDVIREYKAKHPEVKTYADVYFPCEFWVKDHVNPELAKYGLQSGRILEGDAKKLAEVMEYEDNFIVPSTFVADTYRQYYPDKNYIVIPYGLTKWANYKKKQPKKTSDEIKTFVYAGGVTIQKGCDYLLRYFKNHPEVELHIFGNIPNNQKKIFDEYLECKNIIFQGWVAKSQLQEYLSKYDVGVHLSRYDAYSLSVGELMGAGLPVLVSDKTGIFFTIEEIQAGLVTPLEDTEIEKKFAMMRQPDVYNGFVDNLDKYLNSSPRYYEDEIVEFYKKQLGND